MKSATFLLCALSLRAISASSDCSADTVLPEKDGSSLLQSGVKMEATVQEHASIINGTVVANEADKYSFFAMPTQDAMSDLWAGCGASIISPTWGLTAAHCQGGGLAPCQNNGNIIKLWLGDITLNDEFGLISAIPGGKSGFVLAEVVCHPKFDGKCSHGHDVTLLKLKTKLPDWVKPVPLNLHKPGFMKGVDAVGEVTKNIGFGLREKKEDKQTIDGVAPRRLHEADLKLFEDKYHACASVYEGGFGCSDSHSEGKAINMEQQFCAGATDTPQRDTCSGDSGAPTLDKNGVQIGIVSYGGGPGEKMSGPGRICADPAYMGVYTRVSAPGISDFILEHVKDLPHAHPC